MGEIFRTAIGPQIRAADFGLEYEHERKGDRIDQKPLAHMDAQARIQLRARSCYMRCNVPENWLDYCQRCKCQQQARDVL